MTDTLDNKETFFWNYDKKYDPTVSNPVEVVQEADSVIKGEDLVWERTVHLGGFKDATITYWQHCLHLARRLVRLFALALDLPEDYFDNVTTNPGADGLYIHYPGVPKHKIEETPDVGIGSHTDIQCITLLWQDMSGGLEVLSAKGEWLQATPIEGTFVVNIGDFLQRLSNNKFKSTVHRVYNLQESSRYSMPFFFGFNYDAVCSVVPTCIDEEHPPMYEPISCGKVVSLLICLIGVLLNLKQWREDRFALARVGQSQVK